MSPWPGDRTRLNIGLLMGLPLGTYTFLKYRREWHEN